MPDEPKSTEPKPMEMQADNPGGRVSRSGTASAKDQAQDSAPQGEHPVDAWWREKIQGSIVGRNTEVWNYLQEILPDLKKRIDAGG